MLQIDLMPKTFDLIITFHSNCMRSCSPRPTGGIMKQVVKSQLNFSLNQDSIPVPALTNYARSY